MFNFDGVFNKKSSNTEAFCYIASQNNFWGHFDWIDKVTIQQCDSSKSKIFRVHSNAWWLFSNIKLFSLRIITSSCSKRYTYCILHTNEFVTYEVLLLLNHNIAIYKSKAHKHNTHNACWKHIDVLMWSISRRLICYYNYWQIRCHSIEYHMQSANWWQLFMSF